MLDIKDVCLSYGNKVILDHFNLTVQEGEIVCLSGESGCGKTSLLNAIIGFVPICSGSISVDNIFMSPSTVDRLRRRIAWLPQELSLPSEWVKEMVHLPFQLKGNRNVVFSEEKLFHCFDLLGLDHQLYDKRVDEISGGQRQRIMIAVSTLLHKKLLLADEPTSALDTASTEKVIDFFRQTAREGMSVLIVSHDHLLAESADRHIILSQHGID
jgi:putative ABC transport system ATP-binding protein